MSDLISRAHQIKNETQVGANTAERVGSLFEDIAIKINNSTNVVNIIYDELLALINTSGLTVGQFYKITDYKTIHYILEWDDALTDINEGNTEPIIVEAISNNKLSNYAYSELFPNDEIHYDPNPINWLNDIGFSFNGVIIPNFKGCGTVQKILNNLIQI